MSNYVECLYSRKERLGEESEMNWKDITERWHGETGDACAKLVIWNCYWWCVQSSPRHFNPSLTVFTSCSHATYPFPCTPGSVVCPSPLTIAQHCSSFNQSLCLPWFASTPRYALAMATGEGTSDFYQPCITPAYLNRHNLPNIRVIQSIQSSILCQYRIL